MDATTSPETLKAVRVGFGRALPIMLGYAPVAFAFGVLATQSGMPIWLATATSILMFAGSGQFITISLWFAGAGLISTALAVFVTNLRYFLMAVALAPHVRPLKGLARLIYGWQITDELFAVHITAFKQGWELNKTAIFTATGCAQFAWVMGTVVGALCGRQAAYYCRHSRSPFLHYAAPRRPWTVERSSRNHHCRNHLRHCGDQDVAKGQIRGFRSRQGGSGMNPTSLGNMMICVGVCVLATVLPRILPLYAFSRELPAFVKTWLNYIPAAVMAALVAPDLLFYGGTFNPDPLDNVFLLAGIASMIFAIVSKNFFATIVFAMAFVAGMRYFGLYV